MVVVAQRQSGVLWTLRSRFQNSPTTQGPVLELVYIEVLETSAERIESSSLSWPINIFASIAQLDRVLDYGSSGWGFEHLYSHSPIHQVVR